MKFVPRLITFRISHYCEKVRWALDRLGLTYVEESHLPLLHRIVTVPLGGGSVPILVTDSAVLTDSTEILRYLDSIAPPYLKLYPDSPIIRQEIHQLEVEFNQNLGKLVRQWGYFYGLQAQQLMQPLWCARIPRWEQTLFPLIFPLACRLVRRVYQINPVTAKAASWQIQQIFAAVSQRLNRGQNHLVGDCFSAADLTFACLAAPVLLPSEYGGVLPEITPLPDAMVELIQALRDTIAGKYVLRLYREERFRCNVIV